MAKGKRRAARIAADQAALGDLDKRITAASVNRERASRGITESKRPDPIAQQRESLLNDQALMEKVRQSGVKLGVNREQMTARHATREEQGLLVARILRNPKRYTIGMARPSGMPQVRSMMLAHVAYESSMGAGVKPLDPSDALKWELYFATADFASLFAEMQRDFRDEQVADYVSDILEEWGPNGQIVVGFDLNRVPVVRVSKTYGDSTAWADLPPDASVWSIEGDPLDRMSLAALVFQWRTSENGGTALFGGLRSANDTFRTCAVGTETIRDVVLIAWMLSSRQLRMLESVTQKASTGLPPKARDKKRSIREELVTTVTLRKHVRAQVHEVQAATGHHLTHRFVVRGHWRNQAYGTNRALRRRTYILPYVKGPEGAPFVEREKVYQW